MDSKTELKRSRRWRFIADLLMIVLGALAFGWIPAAFVLILGDWELRPVLRVFWQLCPLAIVPLCGFALCWRWRAALSRSAVVLDSGKDSK